MSASSKLHFRVAFKDYSGDASPARGSKLLTPAWWDEHLNLCKTKCVNCSGRGTLELLRWEEICSTCLGAGYYYEHKDPDDPYDGDDEDEQEYWDDDDSGYDDDDDKYAS